MAAVIQGQASSSPVRLDASRSYVLRGVTGSLFGRSFTIDQPLTIGRLPECDIHVDEAGLSRSHARLTPTGEGILVQDLDSTNGTFVNDQRVMRHMAHPGDEIRVDRIRFRVDPAPPAHVGARQAGIADGGATRRRWTILVVLALNAVAVMAYFLL